ncbi:MAG TPA: hypothetical protein VMH80_17560 [Bryobacteraceae bacterium]|nr:hypothetical protein [Bryobacteraceae bacterium]
MKLHPEELQLARAYQDALEFEELSPAQMKLIMDRGRSLSKRFKAHPYMHNLISAAVIASVFVLDALTLLGLPRIFLAHGRQDQLTWILLASLAAGCAHCWLIYSLGVFSLHEGAAHNLIFSGSGWFAKTGQVIGRNLCRLNHGEPNYYASCHMAHHAKFGTEQDSEFLNFIIPHRFWLAFLPFAAFMNFTDFVIHRPPTYTRSRVISGVLSLLYNGAYAYLIFRSFGLIFMLLMMLAFVPHLTFYLDRMRQFSEHNLMPLDNRNGARSFGVGFWGLLIGGGPWGQPCHWVHHLVPNIPWYQQISLHFYVKSILTECQRRQFLLDPFVGFPVLLWHLVRDTGTFARGGQALGRSAAQH